MASNERINEEWAYQVVNMLTDVTEGNILLSCVKFRYRTIAVCLGALRNKNYKVEDQLEYVPISLHVAVKKLLDTDVEPWDLIPESKRKDEILAHFGVKFDDGFGLTKPPVDDYEFQSRKAQEEGLEQILQKIDEEKSGFREAVLSNSFQPQQVTKNEQDKDNTNLPNDIRRNKNGN